MARVRVRNQHFFQKYETAFFEVDYYTNMIPLKYEIEKKSFTIRISNMYIFVLSISLLFKNFTMSIFITYFFHEVFIIDDSLCHACVFTKEFKSSDE